MRNVRNSVRQEDAHYAQNSSDINTAIRPVLMYESVETWALKKAEQNLLERSEMRTDDGKKEDSEDQE